MVGFMNGLLLRTVCIYTILLEKGGWRINLTHNIFLLNTFNYNQIIVIISIYVITGILVTFVSSKAYNGQLRPNVIFIK